MFRLVNFRLFQTERVCRWQFQLWGKWQKVLQTGRKHCGKRRNCSFWAISPFPSVFKRLILQTRKNQSLFGKGLIIRTVLYFFVKNIVQVCGKLSAGKTVILLSNVKHGNRISSFNINEIIKSITGKSLFLEHFGFMKENGQIDVKKTLLVAKYIKLYWDTAWIPKIWWTTWNCHSP